MLRREALEVLAQCSRRIGAITVATMQAVPHWHQVASDAPLHIDMMGCMGSASSLALGLAMGAPDRPVLVIDGDGCILMQLGTLVTIGHAHPANLTVAIMHDKSYSTSGNQRIPGAETADLAGLALAAGFPVTFRTHDAHELDHALTGLMGRPGPRMLVLDIVREEPGSQWPAVSMMRQIQEVRAHFADPTAKI